MTHTKTSTDCGPDYCDECSRAAQEWVRWPCEAGRVPSSEALLIWWDEVHRHYGWTCPDCGGSGINLASVEQAKYGLAAHRQGCDA